MATTTVSDTGTTAVIDVNEADWDTAVIERSRSVPVVVDFWAPWCGPCRVLGPVLERLAGEMKGTFVLAKVNVDQNQRLSQRFGVQGIPMVIGFRDGKPAETFTGALTETQVRAWLRKLIPSGGDKLAAEAAQLVASDPAQAAERYRAALDEDPAHLASLLGLGRILVLSGDPEGADVLRRVQQGKPGFTEAKALLELSDFLATPASDQANGETGASFEVRFAAAAAEARAGQWESALQSLLQLVQRPSAGAPKDATDRTRRAMLAIFGALDADDPLVARYRRLLANALF